MLPVLHLNGYKINNPTILARISPAELSALFTGCGYTPYFVEGGDSPGMHQAMVAALCEEQNIVPIVEPEVLMDGAHSIERCEAVTATVLHAVF